jgi:PAS domain S-box-containing protein
MLQKLSGQDDSSIETALRESEQRLRWLASIVESSHDAIISTDTSGTIITWNNAAQLLFGYTSEEVIGRPITILIPPERHSEEPLILERISHGERIADYETIRRRRDGGSVNVSLTISPVRNAEGTFVGASGIIRDITRRKRAETREKMLTAELNHRVKNILAQVAAIAKSTHEGSRSPDEFFRSLDGRIQSLAAAHTLLAQRGWQGVGIDELVRSQLAPYASDTNITITGTDVILAVAEIQVLTGVLHELATNAAKYGALSIPDGQVRISWNFKPHGLAATLILEWHESGGPLVASNVQSSYGTDLIRNLVPHELGGTVDLVFAAEGVNCRIEIPIK